MTTDRSVPFEFHSLGPEERTRIHTAVRSLSMRPSKTPLQDVGINQSLSDAWARGGADEVLRVLDQVMLNTVTIGTRFVRKPSNDPARMASYYWTVDYSHPGFRCALDLSLCLMPVKSQFGRLLLSQQVVRLADDDFAYWGID